VRPRGARVGNAHGSTCFTRRRNAPTGKPFALDYVNVARFADGLIVSETYYSDNQAFLTQLGLV
jgi:ketosteroid isomerase-like protein